MIKSRKSDTRSFGFVNVIDDLPKHFCSLYGFSVEMNKNSLKFYNFIDIFLHNINKNLGYCRYWVELIVFIILWSILKFLWL